MRNATWADRNTTWSIKLTCGRKLLLDELHQCRTYTHLYIGHPHKEHNDLVIRTLFEKAKSIGHHLKETHLIQPEIKLISREVVSQNNVRRENIEIFPSHALPHIACIGIFDCMEPINDEARDNPACFSSLRILWFQDDFSPSVAPKIENSIKQIEWGKAAEDVGY